MRLPVPMIAIDGSSNGARSGGRNEKSALVGDPLREETACEPEPLPGPEHGLVGDVDCDLWLEARKRVVEVLRQGTP